MRRLSLPSRTLTTCTWAISSTRTIKWTGSRRDSSLNSSLNETLKCQTASSKSDREAALQLLCGWRWHQDKLFPSVQRLEGHRPVYFWGKGKIEAILPCLPVYFYMCLHLCVWMKNHHRWWIELLFFYLCGGLMWSDLHILPRAKDLEFWPDIQADTIPYLSDQVWVQHKRLLWDVHDFLCSK